MWWMYIVFAVIIFALVVLARKVYRSMPEMASSYTEEGRKALAKAVADHLQWGDRC